MNTQISELEQQLTELYTQQLKDGVILSQVYDDIHRISPITENDTLKFYIQHNPHRVQRGISYKQNPTPKHTIKYKGGIPCFLCMDNIMYQWPNEKGHPYTIDNLPLIFLPNLFPIFPFHFTIASQDHLPQTINVPTLLSLAKALPSHWIIQNGPDAGATNPEHFHYQSFQTTNLPTDLPITIYPKHLIHHSDTLTINKLDHPATLYHFEFSSPEIIPSVSTVVMNFLAQNNHHRVNLLGTYDPQKKRWQLIILLRHTHQKTDFYKTGQPGYAEAAGIISTYSPEYHDHWLKNSTSLYTKLMTDIACTEESEKTFKTLLKTCYT